MLFGPSLKAKNQVLVNLGKPRKSVDAHAAAYALVPDTVADALVKFALPAATRQRQLVLARGEEFPDLPFQLGDIGKCLYADLSPGNSPQHSRNLYLRRVK